MGQEFYLKPNVIAEPLFNQWYAWSYLIPPATAAKYTANSHLQIMESFVSAPEVHVAALKNPEMMGGPFINYDASRVWEIAALLEQTKTKLKKLLDLDQAIVGLDRLLKEIEDGISLESLYSQVPELLKGYVELVYDRYNNPGIRFIEGLLYQSPFYDPTCQSIFLYLDNPDCRSFVLSTPRLASDNAVTINLLFCDRRWDKLFQMREKAGDYQEIRDLLSITETDNKLFETLFSSQECQKTPKYNGDDIRIRYFGHACVLIETKEVSILCDPLIAYENSTGITRYSYADLPEEIDYVLITHNHQDHVMFETLLQIRYKIKNLIVPKSNKGSLLDPSLKLILQQIGFDNVRELDELETIKVQDGQIISLPVLGEHGDLNISAKNAYLIQLKNKSILCAADSNNIESELYKHIHNCFGNIDIMFIGMECDGAPFTWAYGALLGTSIPHKIAQTRRLDGSDSAKAIALVKQFSPKQVYVYAMGQEPWLTYITSIQYTQDSRPIIESNKLVKYCRENNIFSERLFGRKEILLNQKNHNTVQVSNINKDKEQSQVSKEQQQKQENSIRVRKFIEYLENLDIKLTLDQNELCIDAPKGILTKNLVAELKKQKPEIIAILKSKLQ